MSQKIVLKNVRASYLHVFEKWGMDNQEPSFNMQVIIPKDHPQIKALKQAIADAAKEKFPKKVNGSKLVGLKSPLRDGDEERDTPEYEGCYFFNLKSTKRPTVLDRDKTALADEDGVVYSGCYVNVSLALYAFDVSGNKGVGAGLNGLQFHKDGDRLDGGHDAFDDFEAEEGPEDDDLLG